VTFDGAAIAVVDRSEPQPTDGRAIVRTIAAGICNLGAQRAFDQAGQRGALKVIFRA
jgi:NADPH:quinone reductase-like Zn-dependent oxidoreductase